MSARGVFGTDGQREAVDETLALLRAAGSAASKLSGRKGALVQTKVDEATMWAEAHRATLPPQVDPDADTVVTEPPEVRHG